MSNACVVSLLSDSDLRDTTRGMAAREREATAELVVHLAELERRGLHLADGYSSIYGYCHEVLKLTDAEAFLRIEAARAGRDYPLILALLSEGAINLTTVKLLSPHLTAENHAALLQEARGKRKHQVEEIVARIAPRPDVPTSLRKVPARSLSAAAAPATATAEAVVAPPTALVVVPTVPLPPPPTPSSQPVPLAPDRYALHTTIDRDVRDLMDLARDLMSHANPGGDMNALLKAAFEALVEKQLREKLPALQPGEARPTGADSRHIPVAVQREVYVRDRGRCVFRGSGGRVCDSRAFVQFHHVRPWTAGGAATCDNIELRCGPHNRYEARVFFEASRAARSGTSPQATAPGP
jgi:hypothetical protein